MKKLKKRLLLLAVIIGILAAASILLYLFRQTDSPSSEPVIPVSRAEDTAADSGSDAPPFASSQTEDKAETVHVKADAAGTPETITVEAVLKNPGGSDPIPDQSFLTDMKNTEGDEEYEKQADGTILWENRGEDIHYKGTSSLDLPVTMSILYELDGQVMDPDDLAGKTGHLRMRFDYENHTASEDSGAIVPFAAVTLVFLPSDVFYNVEVENGKLISVSGQNLVVGNAFPGVSDALKLSDYEPTEDMELPEYVELTADVVDFELDFTATVITSGLLEDLDPEDLDDIEEMTDDMKELQDASAELTDGTDELYDGVVEFEDGISEYVKGTNAVNDGIDALYEGLDALYEQKLPMREGAAALQSGLEALSASVADMQGQLQTLEDASPETAASLTQMGEALQALQDGLTTLTEGSRQMSEGIHAYTHGVTELYLGTVDLKDGSQELTDAGKELTDAAAELTDGVRELKDGVAEFDEEGIQSLADLAGDSLRDLVNRVRVLKTQDENYRNYSGILDGQTGSVRFLIETDAIE